METKHTPGPWTWFDNGSYVDVTIGPTKFDQSLCMVFANEHLPITEDQRDANAQLIASAPELLEALQNLVFTASKLWDQVKPIKDSGAITVTHPTIEEAKAAINKALGKEVTNV